MKAAMELNSAAHGPGGSEKWGVAARAGFQPVPDVLFAKQQELGLDATDMLVLLNLTSYWWYKDRPPFARTNIIAKRMGVSSRTVQRSLKKLQRMNYIRRDDFLIDDEQSVPAVYLDGLIDKLAELAMGDIALSAKIERNAPLEFSEEVDSIPF